MQVIAGQIEAPLTVEGALEVQGIVLGSITVLPAAHLVLRGICRGSVRIAESGVAQLWGIVEGDVSNEGGEVDVFGIVEGAVQGAPSHTRVSSDSIVRGGRSN